MKIITAFINKYQYIRWHIPLEYVKFITFLIVITITVNIIASHFCSVLITTFNEIWNFRASYIKKNRGIHYIPWPFQYSITALLKILLIFLVYCSSLSHIVNCVGKRWNGWPFQDFVFPLAKRYIKLTQHCLLNNITFSLLRTCNAENFCGSGKMKGMQRTVFCFKNVTINDKKKNICNISFSEGLTSCIIGIYGYSWHLIKEIFDSKSLLNSCIFSCLGTTCSNVSLFILILK